MPAHSLIRENVTLAPLTYYKIGGVARYYAQPTSTKDLSEISNFLLEMRQPYFILGAGSNVLLDDKGFDGLVIHTNLLDRSLETASNASVNTPDPGLVIEVGASVMVIQLLRHCMGEGISGLELLVGIPGNMGGVFTMNAGTKLGEIKDVVVDVTAYDLATGQTRTLNKNSLKYSYRHQHFLAPHEIILKGKVRGILSDPKLVQDRVQLLLTARKKSQPVDKPSCGSVFKNPSPQHQAWQLIDNAGLRGYKVGNAQISEVHTNFIVNLGGATAADVKAVIAHAKTQVKAKFNIELEEEVKIIAHNWAEKRLA